MNPIETDILVVGGGPAGLAAAIAGRLKGFDVTVVDSAHPPIDKACGEGVMPGGVEVLRQLGVRISGADGLPLRGIRFLDGRNSVEARFPSGWGLALRRTSLHQILVARASELDVRLLWDAPLRHVTTPPCRWIVAADGIHSPVRRAAGLQAAIEKSMRFGFRRHYRVAPWTDLVEIHWGSRGQVYVTPVSSEEVGVAVLTRDASFRLSAAFEEFPELRRRLQGAEASSAERGAITISRRLRCVFRGQTVLIGDASGSVDAITGDGLSLAFRQALALAEALASGGLAAYQAAHRRLARRPALMESLLLTLDRRPSLRWFCMRVMSIQPAIFARLLALHVESPRLPSPPVPDPNFSPSALLR